MTKQKRCANESGVVGVATDLARSSVLRYDRMTVKYEGIALKIKDD
jgi:hypothetical protein